MKMPVLSRATTIRRGKLRLTCPVSRSDRQGPARPRIFLIDRVEVLSALHEDAGLVARDDHQAVEAEIDVSGLRIRPAGAGPPANIFDRSRRGAFRAP